MERCEETVLHANARRFPRSPKWMVLPRGRADFVLQLAIWFGFAIAYELARGFVNQGSATGLANGESLVRFERRLDALFEPGLQHALRHVDALIAAVNWTYWLSQFMVVGLGLLWIYLRRNDAYLRVRDTIIVTNTVGLIAYVLLPSAPPRLLPMLGISDTLANSAAINHGDGIVVLAENPYAAMPSLHTADAMIIGVALGLLVRPLSLKVLWLLWPPWVAFALIVTGNHFWVDIAAAALLLTITVPVTGALERLRRGTTEVPETDSGEEETEGAFPQRAWVDCR